MNPAEIKNASRFGTKVDSAMKNDIKDATVSFEGPEIWNSLIARP